MSSPLPPNSSQNSSQNSSRNPSPARIGRKPVPTYPDRPDPSSSTNSNSNSNQDHGSNNDPSNSTSSSTSTVEVIATPPPQASTSASASTSTSNPATVPSSSNNTSSPRPSTFIPARIPLNASDSPLSTSTASIASGSYFTPTSSPNTPASTPGGGGGGNSNIVVGSGSGGISGLGLGNNPPGTTTTPSPFSAYNPWGIIPGGTRIRKGSRHPYHYDYRQGQLNQDQDSPQSQSQARVTFDPTAVHDGSTTNNGRRNGNGGGGGSGGSGSTSTSTSNVGDNPSLWSDRVQQQQQQRSSSPPTTPKSKKSNKKSGTGRKRSGSGGSRQNRQRGDSNPESSPSLSSDQLTQTVVVGGGTESGNGSGSPYASYFRAAYPEEGHDIPTTPPYNGNSPPNGGNGGVWRGRDFSSVRGRGPSFDADEDVDGGERRGRENKRSNDSSGTSSTGLGIQGLGLHFPTTTTAAPSSTGPGPPVDSNNIDGSDLNTLSLAEIRRRAGISSDDHRMTGGVGTGAERSRTLGEFGVDHNPHHNHPHSYYDSEGDRGRSMERNNRNGNSHFTNQERDLEKGTLPGGEEFNGYIRPRTSSGGLDGSAPSSAAGGMMMTDKPFVSYVSDGEDNLISNHSASSHGGHNNSTAPNGNNKGGGGGGWFSRSKDDNSSRSRSGSRPRYNHHQQRSGGGSRGGSRNASGNNLNVNSDGEIKGIGGLGGWAGTGSYWEDEAITGDPMHTVLSGTLQRELGSRQIVMISIGGVIGTGLFLGTSGALQQAGPLGLFLAYSIVGSVVWAVMGCLGEMVAHLPVAGGHVSLATRFVDPSLSIAMGWNYWYNWTIALPAELAAGAVVIHFWNDSINDAVWITIFLFIVLSINLGGSRVFGECEFWFAAIKVLTIVGLIILGIILDAGGGPDHKPIGFQFWRNPGPFVQFFGISGAKGRFLGFWNVMPQAAFSYIGTEITAITAGEAKNPKRTIPKAVRGVYIRILLFYICGVFIIGLLVPSNDSHLSSYDPSLPAHPAPAASPFVIAIHRSGIPVLSGFVNACVLTSACSAASSDLYVSSRAMYALSLSGGAPRFLSATTRWGLPWVCVAVSACFGTLAYMTAGLSGAGTVFNWLSEMSSICGVITWAGIFVTYIRWYQGTLAQPQSIDRNHLPYKAPLQPYASFWGLAVCCFVLVFGGWSVFVRGHWDSATFITSYLPVVLFFVIFSGYKFWNQTEIISTTDMDFISHSRAVQEEVEPPPRNIFDKIWRLIL